ncbi:MAG: type I restriction endonuclease [Spirochaetaceae bacterium]|jgi:type I restriction enzyme R subunit|nr:type I restriction endonuclease [Spirochaetaceae bacterium]
MDASREQVFQNEIISQLKANGWLVGNPENYNRKLALYEEDLLGYIQETQPQQWEKYCKRYPHNPQEKFAQRVANQLGKADPNGANRELRSYGTLGVLRHELKDRGTRFRLCQFKPDHDLNPDTLARYKANRLRVVPELVYSPWATEEHLAESGMKSKSWRIDLVLFMNGLPIVTMELKSEFKQAVDNAIKQYKTTRPPTDPVTHKAEPLLTFKRGALVHFAVSQYEVYMATRLEGLDSFFLPFNKGTSEGGSGNDIPENPDQYATDYLWNEVLLPENLLNILARYVHLQIEEKEDWQGRKSKKETLIFPRYHQWDVVHRLLAAAHEEGPGQKYLIQHSAGSGKSNSIAWTAHQLSSLYDDKGEKRFHSVIVVTDRTVLDAQLQDTIYQFEHTHGVVGRINRDEGEGSKSEKLAKALEQSQPIIIVTIQTFPFVLKAIENSVSLKERNYAIIADEAHSSQSGSTARQLKEVLMIDGNQEEPLSTEEILDATVASRTATQNLSFFAFTATPKPKTLELFGRLPKPEEAPSEENIPRPFHVYTMRQAIEEGFILDVLKNYTNYKVAYNLALKIQESDQEVESKRARVKLNQWVRLHDYNISQKVQVIVEHFKDNILGLLGGQAKAMVVTSSRKEAVRYKLGFDKYIKDKGYRKIHAMVAFSGEVEFNENDPNSQGLIGEKYTEKGSNMNPKLKGRDIRKAFDSDDYQVMIVANKFQTGFDQPKLCAMYVDKKLGGVECVQTLSRLNRIYPGKAERGTFILDFFNEPEEILAAFQPYYQTAELAKVSDPNLIDDLFEKLKAADIFQWQEVEQFCHAFYQKNRSNAAIANICKPAVDRWKHRYSIAQGELKLAKEELERVKKSGDKVQRANAESNFKEVKHMKDTLDIFKKDLGTFVRFYEFMSQIVDYDDRDLEKMSLYARNLRPMLREPLAHDEDIDLDNVILSHYRLSEIKRQSLMLQDNSEDYKLEPGEGLGKAKFKDPKEELLSEIIQRLNELFEVDDLTENDIVNYAYTIRDKMKEDKSVMTQIANNTPEQAMLGDFPKAIDNAILESSEAHQKQMFQLLGDPAKLKKFAGVVFELLKSVG